MRDEKYAVGQVWSYRTRPGESQSRLYIVHITECDKVGTIYHVFLDRLSLKLPKGGVQNVFPHAPVSDKTLDASVIELVETRQTNLPDISEGYQIWREAFDSGGARVFTIPVSETWNHRKPWRKTGACCNAPEVITSWGKNLKK